jgi:hypothetical protein
VVRGCGTRQRTNRRPPQRRQADFIAFFLPLGTKV